jgi:HEPN domain-containing protein
MSKQTAVEWLDQEIINFYGLVSIYKTKQEIIEQAKEMEKQQIIDSYEDGRICIKPIEIKLGEQYYNETFKK